ncbi:MAG TPA: SAM-dependent chlorinase/fluorinase [bacterium]|nr:SAM-dependent chlorinase/fluorinase [bacterium]
MKKSPIVLLTDFGWIDHYAGVLRGVILSICPDTQVIDLSHGVQPQNVAQAAMLLETAYSDFPKGSIFVCVVDPGVGTKRKAVCVKTSHYYFIGPDNGILSLALDHEKRIEIRSIENPKFFRKEIPSSTFHGRDIFSPSAAHLAKRNIFNQLGPRLSKIHALNIPKIKKTRAVLEGAILYFDHFGNAISNIHERDGNPELWKKAEIVVRDMAVGKLRKTYGEGSRHLCAVLNSSSQLEIALPHGSAKNEASLETGDPVTVCLKK